jgi:hypothetical protein
MFHRADSLLAVAESLDPTWPVPVVSRAFTAMNHAFAHTDRAGQPTPLFAARMHEAIGHADRALTRTPGPPAALAARGEARGHLVVLAGEQPADSILRLAEGDLQRAATERPDVARTWYALGYVQFHHGRFAEAADAFKTAYDVDPFLENVQSVMHFLFISSLYASRFDAARQWCDLGRSRFADDPRFTGCDLYLLGASGKTRADASAAWRILRGIEGGDSTGFHDGTWSFRRMMVAAVLARARMPDSARAVLARTARDRGDKPAADGEEAYVRLLVGDRDGALRLLAKLLADRPDYRAWVAALPWYEALRDDARFKALVADR